MLLSIIVPVYNVENYLSKCLTSLLQQDIISSDFEILIINDGSTDNSLKIAEEFSIENHNIKIISQANKGLGNARNTGINNANGKYLLFVDSDDYIKPNCLKKLLKDLEENNLDAIRFNFQQVNESYQIIPKTRNSTYSANYDNKIVNGKTFLAEKLGWACYVSTYIFKTAIIKQNNLSFNEKIYYEDVEWLPRVLMHIEKITSCNEEILFYLRRNGSITKNNTNAKKYKYVEDKLTLIEILSEKVNEQNTGEWYKSMISLLSLSLITYCKKNAPERKDYVLRMIRTKNQLLGRNQFTYRQLTYYFLLKYAPRILWNLK